MPAKSYTRKHPAFFWSQGHVNTYGNLITTNVHNIGQLSDSRAAGFPLPHWRRLIREKVSATTTCSGVRFKVTEYKPSYGQVHHELRSGVPSDLRFYPDTIKYRGNLDPCQVRTLQGLATVIVQDDVAKREATKKYFNKVAAFRRALDGGTVLGELRETIRMLRNPAQSLFNAARQDYLNTLRRRKRSNPKNWARGLSGAWLEFAFGVQPLVNDIKGAIDGLSRFCDETIVTRNFTAVGRQMVAGPESTYSWSPGNNLVFKGTAIRYGKQKYKYRALYMRETSQVKNMWALSRAAELFGLELNQFVPTVWNLMPWSFLVDYFTNIGDVLEQSFNSLQDIRWCSTTIVNSSGVEAFSNLDAKATAAALTQVGKSRMLVAEPGPDARCIITKESWTRGSGGPSVDRIRFELPGSPQKWLNMAALAIQANTIHPQRYKFRG